MLGSTFYATNDPTRVLDFEEFGELDDLPHVDLDRASSADFAELIRDAGVDWVAEEAIRFSAEDGIAITKMNKEALIRINGSGIVIPSEVAEDFSKLACFAMAHPGVDIYELSTF